MKTDDKSLIRKNILQKRNELPEELRYKADLAMAERIIGHQWFYRADILLAFVNYGSEISTKEILMEAWKKNKKVFLPKVEGNDLVFYRVNSYQELVTGYKGIPEPVGDTEAFDYNKYKEERMLLLMPGVAFDILGNRMGYGKGFYDRYLREKEVLQTFSIAIGYGCQQVEKLPVEEHDIKPYQIILV